MQSIDVQLGNLPLILSCYSNGCISIARAANFKCIIDQPQVGVMAFIDAEGISIGTETEIIYEEMLEYKQMPELLSWLKAQNMEMPVLRKGN